ncbi:MAG: DUF4160 domain-containing protein [Candidatus Hydrogenedentales bacterium]
MPTIVREDGFSIRVYPPPREHPPPHVHVCKAGTEVVIDLGSAGALPALREERGMARSDVPRAIQLVWRHHELLTAAWENMHGKTRTER